jgi:Ca-activated chloride channel family protein
LTAPILTQNHICLRDGNRLYVLVRLHASGGTQSRVPLSLGVVLDRSSSMRGKPLRGALLAARSLAEQLNEQDRLAVVVYDRDVHTLWGPAPVTAQGRQQLIDRLDHVMSGYLTNLGGAYIEACRHSAANMGEGRLARVLLLTDGYPSYGICDAQELAEMSAFQHARGITTTAIGFGTAFDEDLLTQMAKSGGGNFYYANTPEDIPKAFSQELGNVFFLGAQDVKAKVTMAPIVEALGVLHDYPAAKNANQIEIQIGEFYQGVPRHLLLELQSSTFEEGGPHYAGNVDIRYKQPDGVECSMSFQLQVPATAGGPVDLHPEVGRELLLLAAARAQADAVHKSDQNALPEARQLLENAAKRLRRFVDAYPNDSEMKDHLQDLEILLRRLAAGALDANARKQVIHKTHHTRLSQLNLPPIKKNNNEN